MSQNHKQGVKGGIHSKMLVSTKLKREAWLEGRATASDQKKQEQQ